MDISEKFRILQERFMLMDSERRKAERKLFFDTKHGIWGPSSMLDAYELFLRMGLDERKGFADLGSGDGRIALVAALFTESLGIEGDITLYAIATRIRDELLYLIPELARCEIINGDYTTAELSHYEVLFIFADHAWSPDFERKLQRECKGVLLSYNNIFPPRTLKKGKTYWLQQLPIVSYPLNAAEKDLFVR